MALPLKEQLRVLGAEHLKDRGVLLLPSQLAFNQLLLLESYLRPREFVYLVEEGSLLDPPLRAYLEKQGISTLEFSTKNTRPEQLQAELHRHIDKDRLVVFIPGRCQTLQNPLTTVPSETLRFLVETKLRVQPLYVERPSEFRSAIEEDVDSSSLFVFAESLERESATLANFQERLLLAGEEAFRQRPLLKLSLGYAVLLGLKKHTDSELIDGNDDTRSSYSTLLPLALALSRVLAKRTTKTRIGIVLPPGRAGWLANMAVVLAGKVPVNLNFTASSQATKSSIQQADLDLYLTGTAFQEKMHRFDWPSADRLLFLDQILPARKKEILWWKLMGRLCSASRLASMIGLAKEGGEKEAVLLFTSGSSGDPKGVVLTHENILANVNQFSSRLNLRRADRILGCLPLFHSFGCTVTLWFPMIEGYTTVTFPSPLDGAKLAELIKEHGINLVLATPTFLRGYLRKATREHFASVRMVIAGAEKLPTAIADAFQEKLGLPVMEGYGLTETSPVTNVNVPSQSTSAEAGLPALASHRPGSVGQPLPGVAVRITNPDNDVPVSLHDTGMIWVRGANIFSGYLGQPERSAAVLRGKWFKTGDLGRMDADGFLYIEGRLSRFSKIGGEMVPHETVETYLSNALRLDSSQERKLVIVGVPDEQKGEALVMLCTIPDLDFEGLRKHLIAEGVPPLWVPKKCLRMEQIPLLASGKLDIRACQEAATRLGAV